MVEYKQLNILKYGDLKMNHVAVLVYNGVVVGVFASFDLAKEHVIKEWIIDTDQKKWKMEEVDNGYDELMFVSSMGDVLEIENWEVKS